MATTKTKHSAGINQEAEPSSYAGIPRVETIHAFQTLMSRPLAPPRPETQQKANIKLSLISWVHPAPAPTLEPAQRANIKRTFEVMSPASRPKKYTGIGSMYPGKAR